MNVARLQPFRCHYRNAALGQAPVALFIQLRARDAESAQQLAEATLGRLVDRVEPAPFAFFPTNLAKEV